MAQSDVSGSAGVGTQAVWLLRVHAVHQYLSLPCITHFIFKIKGIYCVILLFLCPLFSPVSLFCSLSEEQFKLSVAY